MIDSIPIKYWIIIIMILLLLFGNCLIYVLKRRYYKLCEQNEKLNEELKFLREKNEKLKFLREKNDELKLKEF